MQNVHPQYIKDIHGINSMVILPTSEFNSIIEQLEDLEDISIYHKVKKKDTGERIEFSDYLKNRKAKNG